MASKPKAGSAQKPKAKAKKRRMTQAEQSERFIKTAREFGVDETGKEFEGLLAKILPVRKTGK